MPIRTSSVCRRFVVIFLNSLATALIFLILSGTGRAQGNSATDGFTPEGLKTGAPAGSFQLSGFDNINYFNGNLNFSLPLLHIGGRGSAGYTIPLRIERKWRVLKTPSPIGPGGGYVNTPEQNDWESLDPGYGPGVLIGRAGGMMPQVCNVEQGQYDALMRLTFSAGDGTEYELRDVSSWNGVPNPTYYSYCSVVLSTNRGKMFVSSDGSGVTFVSDVDIWDSDAYNISQTMPSGYLLLPDGSRYRIDNGLVSWIRDRNGNKITFSYSYGQVSTITDSLNRQITISYLYNGSQYYDVITYKGFGGATRTVTVWYKLVSQNLRAGYTAQTFSQLFPELNGSASTLFDEWVPSSVVLPDNRSYQFKYNTYGELARVELPTGGAIEYDYLAAIVGGAASGSYGGGGQFIDKQVYRRVTERRVYPDKNSAVVSYKSIISRPESTGGGNLGYVDVENQDNSGSVLLSKERHYYYGSAKVPSGQAPTDYSQWKTGKEWKTENLASDGSTPLQRVENTWQQPLNCCWPLTQPETNDTARPNNPKVTQTLNTLADSNQVSKQTFAFDLHFNQTDVYEYDFGTGAPGALIRRTHTDYITVNPVNGADYAGDTSIHIRNLPSQQQVFDAGGTERTRTTYEYDNYANDANHAALVDRPGIFGLDSGFTTAYTKRGNVTRASRFNLANTGLVGSDTEIAAYSQYDIAGNVVKTKDPKGNIAQISYSSTYQFAYPTTQTSPVPDGSGYYASSTAFTTTTSYDFWTGKVTSSTDANSQTTTAEYNDALDRLTRVAPPAGGGETVYQYGDTVGSLYVRTQTKQDASTWLDDYALFDGLGRTWRAAHYEGPSSWSAKETKFDALGRVSQVSNPYSITAYNAATPAGALWATTTYDALSRGLTVTTPDGSHVDTAYSGNQVTVTDQSLKKRRSFTDAIGRLTQVTEDPLGVAYQTYYTYDVLGNLVKVNQGAQNRYFLYDSLSRLVRARNPELDTNGGITSAAGTYPGLGNSQWSLKYDYDSNGNLTSKTDARNVTANYSYDAINRNIYLSYSDGTPSVERHYDFATNGKGHLYYNYNYSYNTHPLTAAAAYSYTVINSYDAVGRPLNQTQNLLNSSGAWVGYTVSRTYDLAGHVISQTYPSGRAVNYSYNAGGRTSSFSGGLGDGVSRTYADQFVYDPAGQMLREHFGTTNATTVGGLTGLYHNIHYNNRLQMADIRLGHNPNDEWNWSRGALITYFSNQARSAGNAFLNASDNNGNVTMEEHYVPSDEAISTYSITLRDTYDYDGVNRVTQTNGVQRNTAGSYFSIHGQGYDYDQWGNRTISQLPARTWGTAINNAAYTVSTTTNRVNGMTYDFVGNVTNDAGNAREYDGENRMKKAWGSSNWNYYIYDADGRRVRRIVGTQETWQVYGIGGELVAEYPANGVATTPQKEYGYRDGQMLIVGGCDVVRWVVADHLGTPRIEVDTTGSLASVRRHDYLPFGEELTVGMGNGSIRSTGQGYVADCVRQRFGSYERDNESGLDFAQARYYANLQGRFTSPDQPLVDQTESNPQSWNLYAYVRNNPLIYTDPSGLSCYYQNGALIGCDGDGKTKIDGDRLYFTPKKGASPLIYDLNKLQAQEEISDKVCNCKPIPTEGQFARAVFGLYGFGAAIGATGGGAAFAGGVTVGGSSVTTLGLSGGVASAEAALGTAAVTGEFAVIGPKIATSNFLRIPNVNILSMSQKIWNLAKNDAWVRDIIARRIPVFMAQPSARAGTVFAREIEQLAAAGYRQVGRWLLPPP